MDILTIIGIGGCLTLFGYEMLNANTMSIFLNPHGLALVLGGTLAATLVNTPVSQLKSTLHALKEIFFPSRIADLSVVVPAMVRLAEKARRDGIRSLVIEDRVTGDGFLSFAIRTTIVKPDQNYVRQVLEDAVRQMEARHSSAASVFQTMAILAPMFGLLGTLVGIIQVLKDIANPQAIGPAMAIAITTAFYGILLAGLICTPIAGKLRSRSLQERRVKELIIAGMLDIVAGMVPLEVEKHLQAFLSGSQRTA